MLNIATVECGNYLGRGKDYVLTLFDMVTRNLSPKTEGRFVVFTDDPGKYSDCPRITTRLLPPGLKGWWNKLALFAEDAFPKGGRVLYFDLDTAITGPLDEIAAYDGDFAILRDAYRPNGLQSSVMMWKAGCYWEFWRDWLRLNKPEPAGGDQEWIEHYESVDGNPPFLRLQDLFPGRFRSYKVDCRYSIPKNTSVVFFHGNPRPHEVTTGWVPEVWKVGGGSGLEFVVQSNTDDATVARNVTSALKRDCPWLEMRPEHKGTAIIVGGGPSLAETLFYIRGMKLSGGTIFATNGTYRYLKDNSIQPDAHVMLDARPENVFFVPSDPVPKFYASICSPSVLDRAGAELTCWHPHVVRDLTLDHPSGNTLIGGGTTVGLRAIAIAYVLGYRDFRLFGFDSSYRESHHAYPQPLNDGERTVQVKAAGKSFRCAPWMVSQAEEFKEVVSAMVNMGCVVSVYGDGLLPAVAEEMGKILTEVDGLHWPASDQETRASVMWTLPDVEKFVAFCPRRKVAVQAGGNVGVFPKELAKHFEKVITFEPDPVNWACLEKNITEQNIIARKAALGEAPGQVSIEHNAFNPGASHVKAGEDVKVVTLDSLNLDACDLIQLDVEGYELKALKGAEETIRRYSPVIVLEQKGLGDKYGDTDEATTAWLHKLSYTKAGAIHRDVIYKRFS